MQGFSNFLVRDKFSKKKKGFRKMFWCGDLQLMKYDLMWCIYWVWPIHLTAFVIVRHSNLNEINLAVKNIDKDML